MPGEFLKKIRIMKSYNILIAAMMLAAVAAGCGQTEKTEATVAEIEAAQMEGRNAAKAFVTKEWRDTMELQKNLLEAKAAQSKYLINKKPECAAAFDSAFVSTVRTVRPDIADQLK